MKRHILIIIIGTILCSCSSTKLRSYGERDGKSHQKIKTKADLTYLTISQTDFISEKSNEQFKINGSVNVGTELILGQLTKLPEYISKIIKDKKKKFKQTYFTKTTLDFKTDSKCLPTLEFYRDIFIDDVSIKYPAVYIKMVPIPVDKNLFTFKIVDGKLNFSKAKTTKKFPFVNLNIILKASYFDKKEDKHYQEKQITAKNIVLPLAHGQDFNAIYKGITFNSDPFKIDGLKMIEVEITEINPYYLKLDEIENTIDSNKAELKALLDKLKKIIEED